MNDKQRVRDAGIESALVVDDGYDEVPQVAELRDEGAWDSFFDDTQGTEAQKIKDIFPEYDPMDREELRRNQGFIAALWDSRESIKELLGGLFEEYEQKTAENHPFLKAAEAALDALDIPFKRCGRDFVEPSIEVDLIVIDLFLGIQQGASDRKLTVERLKKALERRRDRPLPSIILISQVPTIDQLAKDFREKVKLHASAFRHIRKDDLRKPGKMKGLILTLATHRADSQALAKFVETWEAKAIDAVRGASDILRKIDIDDLQHIRSMLLRFEGLKTSSYILDVFDRVLQYEIESHDAVLEAARRLDEMADDPPPLTISNDRDTYEVLERTLFVNPKRRAHVTGAVWPVAFGDILGPNPEKPVNPRGFFSGRNDLIYFVASPECDLIRKDSLTTVLMVAGSLREIDMTKPGLELTPKTTPIIVVNGSRFRVDWNFGELQTRTLASVRRLLGEGGSALIVARLRKESALNLRQELLSNIGRVGELAPLPRSFRFTARLHFPLAHGGIQPIVLPDSMEVTGNILTPRKGNFASAIIDSVCEDELTEALLNLDIENVAAGKSRQAFEILKQQSRIRQIFRSGFQGIVLPLKNATGTGLLKLDEELPVSDSLKPKVDKIGMIVTDDDIKNALGTKLREAGLIIQMEIQETAQIPDRTSPP